MGVVCALEVCRLNDELGLGLPLQLISFLEEEGSGFGQMLLEAASSRSGSRRRNCARRSGRSTTGAASGTRRTGGFEPPAGGDAAHILDGLTGWIEMHIEQARAGGHRHRIGIISAIAADVHADGFACRGDHAGAT